MKYLSVYIEIIAKVVNNKTKIIKCNLVLYSLSSHSSPTFKLFFYSIKLLYDFIPNFKLCPITQTYTSRQIRLSDDLGVLDHFLIKMVYFKI